MARYRAAVATLAKEAGLDVETTVLILMEAGFQVQSWDTVIPKSSMARARASLNLPTKPLGASLREVRSLAERAGKDEGTVRDLLFGARILRKKRLKWVPSGLLRRAEETLGLVKSQSVEDRSSTVRLEDSLRRARLRKSAALRKERPTWRIIGPAQDLVFLAPGDVLDLHRVLVEDFRRSKDPIDPPGVRSQALLESAVHRPRTALGKTDKYPSVAMAGASLVHAMVLDHPFHNGNKRTALVALLAFLDRNGWVLTVDQDLIYDFLLKIADHKLEDGGGSVLHGADKETLEAANWLQRSIRRVSLRERTLQFRHLRPILQSYGCMCEAREGNRINLRRGKLLTQVFYRNEGTDVEKNTMHKIRKDLELDEEHGYDADIFYTRGPQIPEFINKYRKLLDRLAKV